MRYALENFPVFLSERRHQWRWDTTHQTIFSLPVCLAPIYLAAPLSFRFSNAFVSISQQGRKMLLIAFLYLCATTVSATCFHPNGTIPGPDYQPCNNTVQFSMCCAWNRTYDADQSLQNGLCYNPIGNYYWRESCTDPTWTSEACSPLCRSGRKSYFGSSEFTEGRGQG